MTITAKDEYKATLDEVYQLLTNPDFLKQKYEAVGSRHLDFQECQQKGEIFRIRWTREVPAEPPSLIKAFVEPWNKLTEVMEWRDKEGGKEGTYKAEITDLSSKIRGKFLLVPTDDGCIEQIEMVAESSILFFGDKIVALIEKDTQKNLAGEYQFTLKHLGDG
jgi:hypothetical protein